MSRRLLVPLIICILLAASFSADAQQPSFLGLTLLTTNDLHANLLPFNHADSLSARIPHTKNVGGAARRATYIDSVRSEAKIPVLLLDSGDTTYGVTPLAKAFHGAPDVQVMNALGYVAMGPGNHEFQWPATDIIRNIEASRFPWVCANLAYEKTGKLYLQPYIIREYCGVKIAFLGLITDLVNHPNYKGARELGLQYVDYIEAAKKFVPELRQQADIVICLSHLGVNNDKTLANSVPGIDIILGGHSHTRLPQPVMIPAGTATATSLGAVPIVQAFCWGSEIGRTDVVFHRDPATGAYSLMSCKGELISIDSSVPDDPAIAGLVQRWEDKRAAMSVPAPAKAAP